MTEQLTNLWDTATTNPWVLLGLKIVLVIIIGFAVQLGLVWLHTLLTREFARWLWGYLGVFLMIGAPVAAVFLGGWWWVLPVIAMVILALYTRVDYRDKGVPTTWMEVSGSFKWRSLGYADLKGPAEVAGVAEYLIHDATLKPGIQALAEGRLEESRQEFQTLATTGNAAAMNNLGVIYEAGLGVVPSKKEALMWYRKAADAGVALAQHNLAVLLAADHLLNSVRASQGDRKRDFIEAYRLFSSAAAQGLKLAKRGLRDLRKKMTRDEIAAAKRADG